MKQTVRLRGQEPEPKQFWTIAAGAEEKSFYMMEPKADPETQVPVTKTKFVRQASWFIVGWTWFAICAYTVIILACMSVGRGLQVALDLLDFEFEKYVSLSFELVK